MGRRKPSEEAYDTRVAGVVSVNPGVILGKGGDSKAMIATTGRVPVRVDATKQGNCPVRLRLQPCVMPSGHEFGPNAIRIVEQLAEFDPVIALHAGIGRPPRRIFVHEVVNDLNKLGLQIERVERDSEFVGDAASILGIAGSAAALFMIETVTLLGTTDADRRLLAMAHENANHVVPLLGEQMGCDAGIDSATHGQHNTRHTASLRLPSGSGKIRSRRRDSRVV